MVVGHSLIYLNFYNFSLFYDFIATACNADKLGIYYFSFSAAVVTVALTLHDHRAHSLHLDYDSFSFAFSAYLDLAATFSSTINTISITLNCYFSCFTVVNFVK